MVLFFFFSIFYELKECQCNEYVRLRCVCKGKIKNSLDCSCFVEVSTTLEKSYLLNKIQCLQDYFHLKEI